MVSCNTTYPMEIRDLKLLFSSLIVSRKLVNNAFALLKNISNPRDFAYLRSINLVRPSFHQFDFKAIPCLL